MNTDTYDGWTVPKPPRPAAPAPTDLDWTGQQLTPAAKRRLAQAAAWVLLPVLVLLMLLALKHTGADEHAAAAYTAAYANAGGLR